LQQSALHLAAEWGESHFVSEWLISLVSHIFSQSDSFGRYSLHAYCALVRILWYGSNLKTLKQRAQVVGVLPRMCNGYPEAIHTKDEGW